MAITLDCKLEIHGNRGLAYTDTNKRSSEGAVSDDFLTQRTVKRLADWVEQREDSTKQDFELLGRFLYRLLFGDDRSPNTIRRDFEDMYESFLDLARQDEATRLRLWLIFHQDADALASLPWEFLFMPQPGDETRGLFLAGEETKLILTRFVPEVGDLVSTLRPEAQPLRILVAHAFPEDPAELLPKLDPSEVIEQIDSIQGDGITVNVLANATFDALQKRIEDERPHIVHFIGHGKPGALALFRPSGDIERDLARTRRRLEADWCDSEQVATLFAAHKPHLVFLHACHGAASFTSTSSEATSLKSLTNLARELVYAQLPAVIAMQYAISNSDAAEFAGSFYRSLADGLPMDEAIAVARQQLARPTGREAFGHRRFATPVVYLQTSAPIIDAPTREPPAPDLVQCPHCNSQLMPAETVAQLALDKCPYCQRSFARCERGHANTLEASSCARCESRIVNRAAVAASPTTTVAQAGSEPASTNVAPDTSFRG